MVRTRQSTKRKADSDVNTAQPPADSPTQQKLPVRAKDNELLESKAPVKSAQGTLKVFDDDDDDDEVMTIGTAQTGIEKPAPAPAPEPESEEESDDDAAPEAVSTQHAASSIKMSAHTAQKAAQQQAAALKRKRQGRDALFKQQAEERKKVEEADEATTHRPAETSTGRKRSRRPLFDVLPDEFLTGSSDEGSDEGDSSSRGALVGPKRRKVATVERKLTRLDRAPRDERVGSTVYRVAKKTDERLAPKSKKQTKNIKTLLLKRNRAPAVKPRSGFFKK